MGSIERERHRTRSPERPRSKEREPREAYRDKEREKDSKRKREREPSRERDVKRNRSRSRERAKERKPAIKEERDAPVRGDKERERSDRDADRKRDRDRSDKEPRAERPSVREAARESPRASAHETGGGTKERDIKHSSRADKEVGKDSKDRQKDTHVKNEIEEGETRSQAPAPNGAAVKKPEVLRLFHHHRSGHGLIPHAYPSRVRSSQQLSWRR